MKLARDVLIALILGVVIGITMNLFVPDTFSVLDKYVFGPAGDLFIRLLKMMIVPVVFFSLTLGVANVGDLKQMGRIGIKTFVYFLITTALALIIAVSLGVMLQPGSGVDFETEGHEYEANEVPSVADTLLNIVPENPIQALAEADMLQIIFFSIIFGIGIIALRGKADVVIKFIEQGNDIVMEVVKFIITLMPYGAFVLIASAIGNLGMDAITSMLMYMGVVLLALFIHAAIVYGPSVYFLGKKKPLQFVKAFFPAMAAGFSTSSSTAVLPISMEVAQNKLNIKKSVSSFVQPLGAMINMDGTAIFQGIATLFIAQAYNIDLSLTQILIVIITALLASVGTVGVPGSGIIILALVLQAVNLPVEGIAMIIGVDRILDMFRTAINITGDVSCALYINEKEKINEEEHPQSYDKVSES